MTIIDKSKDTWDTNITGVDVVQGLYYYIISSDNTGTEILGNSEAIQSVALVPYMDVNRLELWKTKYDVKRFGDKKDFKPSLKDAPFVYRIKHQPKGARSTFGDSSVLEVDIYKTIGKNIGGPRNWKNEGKLYQAPYQFGVISDFIGKPLEVNYHLCKSELAHNNNRFQLTGVSPISDKGTYTLQIAGYKGDDTANTEASINSGSNLIANTSSAYSRFMSNSSSQNTTQLTTGLLTVGASVISGIVAPPVGVAMGISGGVSAISSISNNLANKNDIKSTPNALKSGGSDVNLSISLGGSELTMFRYGIDEVYANIIGDFFALYGYKQNKIIRPNLRSRHYYNYLKTIGCSITGTGIPKEHLSKIQQIYNNGITTWHVDNPGVIVGDYSKDNYEV